MICCIASIVGRGFWMCKCKHPQYTNYASRFRMSSEFIWWRNMQNTYRLRLSLRVLSLLGQVPLDWILATIQDTAYMFLVHESRDSVKYKMKMNIILNQQWWLVEVKLLRQNVLEHQQWRNEQTNIISVVCISRSTF